MGKHPRRRSRRPDRTKYEATPTRREAGRRPRRKGVGYLLRLPEPSYVLAGVVSLLCFLGAAAGVVELLIVAIPTAALAVWVWRKRQVFRYNAEGWRLRRDGHF